MHMYLDLGVETKLFRTISDVVVSEVRVIKSQGYSMIYPQNINWLRLGSSFWGEYFTKIWIYVMTLYSSLVIILYPTKEMGSVTLTLFLIPCANLPSSFAY